MNKEFFLIALMCIIVNLYIIQKEKRHDFAMINKVMSKKNKRLTKEEALWLINRNEGKMFDVYIIE